MKWRCATGAGIDGAPSAAEARLSDRIGVETPNRVGSPTSIRWVTTPVFPLTASRTAARTWKTPAGSSNSRRRDYQAPSEGGPGPGPSTSTSDVWTGRSPRKGLAVLSFGSWRVTAAAEHDARGRTTIAAHVSGELDFRLAAVWALADAFEPLPAALDRLAGFLREGPSVVAGDFNATVGRAGGGERRLRALGFVSAYHRRHQVEIGTEREPTLYLRRREGLHGHRDLLFLDGTLLEALREVEVGEGRAWAGASDHVPVVAVIDTSALVP